MRYTRSLSSFAPIAQLVEQIPLKDKVVGSIPTGRTASPSLRSSYAVRAHMRSSPAKPLAKQGYSFNFALYTFHCKLERSAGVAKLVDARALGARGAILGGASPLPGT